MSRSTNPKDRDRKLVIERDRMTCQLCGNAGTNIHHRVGRGMGGSRAAWMNLPGNLLVLCGSGTEDCHGWVTGHPEEAAEYGWVVHRNRGVRPTDVQIWLPLEDAWFYLEDNGARTRPHQQEPRPAPAGLFHD